MGTLAPEPTTSQKGLRLARHHATRFPRHGAHIAVGVGLLAMGEYLDSDASRFDGPIPHTQNDLVCVPTRSVCNGRIARRAYRAQRWVAGRECFPLSGCYNCTLGSPSIQPGCWFMPRKPWDNSLCNILRLTARPSASSQMQ